MQKIIGKQGILFDFDETLNNTLLGSQKAWKEVTKLIHEFLKQQGISLDQTNLQKEIVQLDDAMNRIRQYDRDDWWEQFISSKTASNPPKEFVVLVTETYWQAIVEGSELYPDTLDLLRYLKTKEYQLGLLSDTDFIKGMKAHRIKESGLEEWFQAIVVSGETGIKTKPAPEPFHILAQRLDLTPEECIFIGDKPFTDIKGAKDAGMTTILVQRRNWELSVEPDYLVKTLKELQQLL